jgi:AraC-like DNA-binding protein
MLFHKEVYNPQVATGQNLPFWVRSAGHYQCPPDWRDNEFRKDFVELFWGIEGEGCFMVKGKPVLLRPGQVLLHFPGDVHSIRSASLWRYRWFTMVGPLSRQLVDGFGLGRECRSAGPCPEELFTQLESELTAITPSSQRRATELGFMILSRASGGEIASYEADPLVRRCQELIQARFTDFLFNVNTLAAELGLHRSTLSKQFQRKTGMSLIQFLIACRLKKALSLLRETTWPIQKVARHCGYADPDYFAKSFKRFMGRCPGEFRRK